jgi:hypothetical protein
MKDADQTVYHQISAIGRMYRDFGGEAAAARAMTRGEKPEAFAERMQAEVEKQRAIPSLEDLGFPSKKIQTYNLTDLIRALLRGNPSEAPLEYDVSRALGGGDGLPRIPWGALQLSQRDYNIADALTAKPVRGPITGSPRPWPCLVELGANVTSGWKGGEVVPAFGTAVTVSVQGEIAQAPEVNPVTSLLTVTPARVAAIVEPSKQTLLQAAGVDVLLTECQRALWQAVEHYAFNGSGSSEPRGVRNVSGIGSVAGGTDGATLAHSHLVDLEAACVTAKSGRGPTGYAINGPTLVWSKKTLRGTGLPPLYNDAALQPMNGHRAAITQQLPSNLVKGGSGTVCSSVVYSQNWSALLIALAGNGLTVMRDPYTKASTAQVRFILEGYFDVLTLDATAFSKMDDAKTA